MRHLNEAGRQRGMTLIELMVGLAIAAILMMAAAPYFGDYSTNSKLRENGNLLYSEALIAQSEAIKRSGQVRLVTSAASIQVIDATDPAKLVVVRERPFTGGVSAPAVTIEFNNNGQVSPFGSSGSVNLSKSGVTCSDDLRCPGLRVDAGGAMRLCGNILSGCT